MTADTDTMTSQSASDKPLYVTLAKFNYRYQVVSARPSINHTNTDVNYLVFCGDNFVYSADSKDHAMLVAANLSNGYPVHHYPNMTPIS